MAFTMRQLAERAAFHSCRLSDPSLLYLWRLLMFAVQQHRRICDIPIRWWATLDRAVIILWH
jgi:hypothetical protein